MAWRVLIALGLLGTGAGCAAAAAVGVPCHANGTIFDQGAVACIPTNAGPKLARCEMVFNVSSWTILVEACPPTAPAVPPGGAPASPSAPRP